MSKGHIVDLQKIIKTIALIRARDFFYYAGGVRRDSVQSHLTLFFSLPYSEMIKCPIYSYLADLL